MWKKKNAEAEEGPAREGKSPANKKPKKKGKLLLVLLVLPVLLGGAFGVLAAMGKVPGVSLAALLPKGKPGASAPAAKKDGGPQPKNSASEPKPKTAQPRRAAPQTLAAEAPKPMPDLDKGAKAMARIWERIAPEKVAEMAGSYRDPQLARILNSMDSKKSAAVLGVLDPKRAALLCQEMEKQAAMPEPTPENQQSPT